MIISKRMRGDNTIRVSAAVKQQRLDKINEICDNMKIDPLGPLDKFVGKKPSIKDIRK